MTNYYPRRAEHRVTITHQSVSTYHLKGGNSNIAWPSANLALYIPFINPAPFLIERISVQNGDTTSGNIDVGVYDRVGTRLVSAGSTAQSGAIQTFDVTDTVIGEGLFYFGYALDNGTGQYKGWSGWIVPEAKMTGTLQQASAFPLPATATFAAMAQNDVPTHWCLHGAAI